MPHHHSLLQASCKTENCKNWCCCGIRIVCRKLITTTRATCVARLAWICSARFAWICNVTTREHARLGPQTKRLMCTPASLLTSVAAIASKPTSALFCALRNTTGRTKIDGRLSPRTINRVQGAVLQGTIFARCVPCEHGMDRCWGDPEAKELQMHALPWSFVWHSRDRPCLVRITRLDVQFSVHQASKLRVPDEPGRNIVSMQVHQLDDVVHLLEGLVLVLLLERRLDV